MALPKVRECVQRARASVARKVSHFVLFHLVDGADGLQPSRLQEWGCEEELVADQIERYATDHAAEYRIAQTYKLGAFEEGADDAHPLASAVFKVGAGNEVNGETHPPNERGMIRQNMAHTEFAMRWGAERAERANVTTERVLGRALEREEKESARWMQRAIEAEAKLEKVHRETVDEQERRTKAELERLDTQHKVATRQRLADEALKMFPVLSAGLVRYVSRRLGGPAMLPAGKGKADGVAAAKDTAEKPGAEAAEADGVAAAKDTAEKPGAEAAEADGVAAAKDKRIADAVERLCLGLTQDEVVRIRMAVTEKTWTALEEVFDALQGE